MSENQNITIQLLLEMPPNEVQSWLKDVWSGGKQVEEKFNWLGFAEVAAFEARNSGKLEEPNIEWAKIAISVYDWLAAMADDTGKNSFLLSSMNLRAYMINLFGTVSGHPVLDLNQIIKWLKDSFVFSVEEASDLSKMWLQKDINWKHQNVKTIRELRLIKNRLNVIKFLVDCEKLIPDEEINKWLSLKEKLP